MNKIEITLRQHTPLLHFQPMQEGATLRASEVKPKLDKFLLKRMGNNIKTEWLIRDTKSLNYKLKVSIGSQLPKQFLVASYIKQDDIRNLTRRGVSVLSNTPFFAQEQQNKSVCRNINKWEEIEKKGILFKENIVVEILTKYVDLSEFIAKHIQLFFLCNNFGTRQTKGFGSFTVTQILIGSLNECNKVIPLQDNETILTEYVTVCKNSCNIGQDLQSIFEFINSNYKLLKAGTNRPYRKSLLRNYVDKEYGILWEKRYIKRNFYGFVDKNDRDYILKSTRQQKVNYKDDEDYCYVRAMLGLAEQFEFLLDGTTDKMVLKFKPDNKNIERFASPLTFKVIDDCVYILINEIPKAILDESFDCLVSFKEDKGYTDESLGKLKTLSDFSIVEFMKYACENENFKFRML